LPVVTHSPNCPVSETILYKHSQTRQDNSCKKHTETTFFIILTIISMVWTQLILSSYPLKKIFNRIMKEKNNLNNGQHKTTCIHYVWG